MIQPGKKLLFHGETIYLALSGRNRKELVEYPVKIIGFTHSGKQHLVIFKKYME